MSSLGLKAGDQIIVTQRAGAEVAEPSQPASNPAPIQPPSQLANLGAVQSGFSGVGGSEFAETDAGFLVHRVCHPHIW